VSRIATALIIALIVLNVATGWLLLSKHQAFTKLESEHSALADSYRKLLEDYGSLNEEHVKVRSWYSELQRKYSSMQAEYESLSSNYQALQAKYVEVVSKHEMLAKEYTALTDSYRKLESEHSALLKEYRSLGEEYEKLRTRYSELQESYFRIQNEYEKLLSTYQVLQASYSELMTKYEKLAEDYGKLLEEYGALVDSYKKLLANHTTLKGDYEALLAEYSALTAEYENLLATYIKIRNTIEYISKWLGVLKDAEDSREFYKEFLRLAVESVKSMRDVDLYQFAEPLPERALKVFNFTLYHLYYCHDSYVRYLDVQSLTIKIRQEVFMLPNETWANKCGDCEDLSLFAYALLGATQRSSERFYLIGIYSLREGHMALLAVESTTSGKGFYIVDLAGNYLNSVGIYYNVTIVSGIWPIPYFLNPLDLRPETKQQLLKTDLAEVVFYDYRTGRWSSKPSLRYYTDAYEALSEWYEYWREDINPLVVMVLIAEDTYMVFTSISSLATWLNHYG